MGKVSSNYSNIFQLCDVRTPCLGCTDFTQVQKPGLVDEVGTRQAYAAASANVSIVQDTFEDKYASRNMEVFTAHR